MTLIVLAFAAIAFGACIVVYSVAIKRDFCWAAMLFAILALINASGFIANVTVAMLSTLQCAAP